MDHAGNKAAANLFFFWNNLHLCVHGQEVVLFY